MLGGNRVRHQPSAACRSPRAGGTDAAPSRPADAGSDRRAEGAAGGARARPRPRPPSRHRAPPRGATAVAVNRTVLSEQIKDVLMQRIVEGHYEPGQRVVELRI